MLLQKRVMALALAAFATAEAFTVPGGGVMLRSSGAGRPALRSGARTVQAAAIYEPAVRIGHGFDIPRTRRLTPSARGARCLATPSSSWRRNNSRDGKHTEDRLIAAVLQQRCKSHVRLRGLLI